MVGSRCLARAFFLIITLALVSLDQYTRASSSENDRRIHSLTADFCAEMRLHKTLWAGSPVDCGRLALVRFKYFGFDNQVHDDGELVVLDAAANRVANIFSILFKRHFPIQQAKLLNRYDGDDESSMADNNTSAFNDRRISGSSRLSIHAYGLAIDVNPRQNPFYKRQNGILQISPKSGKDYLKRADVRPGMAEAVVDVFEENGFPIWGGDWSNPIDYQHFQVGRDLAVRLARASSVDAKAIFEKQVRQHYRCRQAGKSRKTCTARTPT